MIDNAILPADTAPADDAAQKAAAHAALKLEKRLVRQVAQAITDFGLIEDGDKVMVCVSGGKDSYGLLDVLRMLQQRNGHKFELIAVNLDRVADELGCTKIALGHHRDDMLQTFFLNMFFGGKLKGMPPKVQSDRGDHLIIRPLAYVAEDDLTRWAEHRKFPIIPCTLCGSQENLQRKQIGQMLRDWQQLYPGRIENMAVALRNLVPSHFMDPRVRSS